MLVRPVMKRLFFPWKTNGKKARFARAPHDKALRSAAARYACSGRKNSVKRKKKSPLLDCIITANWRLENAKSPAAMLQENSPHTPHA